MHDRRVLILRLPALADKGRRGIVGVCEDPGTGEQHAFASADELWALVEAESRVVHLPRTNPRAPGSAARISKPKPEEDS